MSDEKNFFSRWSRRKRDADLETTEQSKPGHRGDVLVSKLPTATLTQASPFDAASLPAIDSIGPGSDIHAFLDVGVPAVNRFGRSVQCAITCSPLRGLGRSVTGVIVLLEETET